MTKSYFTIHVTQFFKWRLRSFENKLFICNFACISEI